MTYTGERNSDGRPHGPGTYTNGYGDTYTGEFKDDKFNGQGTAKYADGSKRTGEWKDGKLVP